ncbi:MAG: hypothetical protein LAT82_01245 [Nanoarchaeota archaeon]|nr:hypothetical protein [Nanoarchaeota archaeon]
MKITDSKGNKKDISSFFHSKHKENLFKKIFYIIYFILLFITIMISLNLIFSPLNILISVPLITILFILLYIFKSEYLSNIVFKLMKRKEDYEIDKKLIKSRKYKNINSKKNKKLFKNTPFNSKKTIFNSKFNFKNKSNKSYKIGDDSSSYIEIK